MSRSLPHLTLTTSTSSLSPTSPIFPTISPTHTRPLARDPYLPCDVPRQSGGSAQIPSLTGFEPKLIETEAIEPEDLEPRKIELDRNLGTDPYQIQERLMRSTFQNPVTEDMDEFGKVGAGMSYIQSLPIMTQRRVLQIRILKMENYEKCKLHHCICKIGRTVNHLEDQLHRRNLLQCCHQGTKNRETNSRVLFSNTLTRQIVDSVRDGVRRTVPMSPRECLRVHTRDL